MEDGGDKAGPKAVCGGEEVQTAAWKVAANTEPDVDEAVAWQAHDQTRQDQTMGWQPQTMEQVDGSL